jgi:chromosome segregation ATPase
MQKEDEETNTIYLYANEKERYEAQIRSLRAQVDDKLEELTKLDSVKGKSEEYVGVLNTEVEELLKLNGELEETVKAIENAISTRQIEDDIVQKTNAQVEKVEKLRNEKTTVLLLTYH